jgi:hypothetical protein
MALAGMHEPNVDVRGRPEGLLPTVWTTVFQQTRNGQEAASASVKRSRPFRKCQTRIEKLLWTTCGGEQMALLTDALVFDESEDPQSGCSIIAAACTTA